MNANELADELEIAQGNNNANNLIPEVIPMLRQQQAEILAGKIMIKGYGKTIDEQQSEIEVLKKQCALLQEGYNAQAILLGVETGLTPDTHPANPYQSITDTKIEPTVVSYTHPVKELTDEKIHNLMDEIEVLVHGDIKRAMYRMARKVESILNE